MVWETERLLLATWQPEDWLTFRAIASYPEVMRYIGDGEPWPNDRTQQFVTAQMDQ